MLLLSSADIFQSQSFKKIFQEHYQSVLWFGSRSGSVGPVMGPNCLQRLPADDKSPLASKELNVCVIAIKQRNSKGGVPNLPTHGFG